MYIQMKITAFWDMAPFRKIEIDWRFRGAYCIASLGRPSPIKRRPSTTLQSALSVYNLHTYRRENLSSHIYSNVLAHSNMGNYVTFLEK
jgi:hypothetical protein